MSTVLVTGGTGFVGSHCILQLLAAGHRVRSTVRNLQREPEVLAMLSVGGVQRAESLCFLEADLTSDSGWTRAITGCDFVLHVASPFPADVPAHEDELIVPAREGTLRVLRISRDAGVRRVVLTSSFAAIGYGHAPRTAAFTEADWTDPEAKGIAPYVKSKTLAERAAWDFMGREGGSLELTVINPVGVFGPVLGPDFSASIRLVQRLMNGTIAGTPRLYFGVVDVRDVADLHIRAMNSVAANGQRFLASGGNCISMHDMATTLKANLGVAAARVPARQLPDWLVRVAALRDRAVRQILPELGKFKNASNEKARRVLGWKPRSNEEAIIATAQSLIELGLLADRPRSQPAAAPAPANCIR